MNRIDSHHHFWNYDVNEYGWINDSMAMLKRDFTPADLKRELAAAGVDGVVSVQARQTVEETRWLIDYAARNEFIRGVVGWVPLADDDVGEILSELADSKWLRAVRHVVQDEPDDRFILGDAFGRGIRRLHEFGLVYDILIFAKQLGPSIQFVDRHPTQPFVLDHIAKPTIQANAFDKGWERDIRELAKREHVACKFSGVATEVREEAWDVEKIKPYWDVALEAFSPQRLMFGSDWPVCLLKTDYGRWVQTCTQLASELSEAEQAQFWSKTAETAYQLES